MLDVAVIADDRQLVWVHAPLTRAEENLHHHGFIQVQLKHRGAYLEGRERHTARFHTLCMYENI